jgi:hypothetical protein
MRSKGDVARIKNLRVLPGFALEKLLKSRRPWIIEVAPAAKLSAGA